MPERSLGSEFFPATPGFGDPLPASQYHHEPAPSHFRHYVTPGNPCSERSCNCYRLLQALEAIREALMAGGLSRVLIAPMQLSWGRVGMEQATR